MKNPATVEGASREQGTKCEKPTPSKTQLQCAPIITVALAGPYTASAAGITVDYKKRARGSPICSLARKLVEAGHDPAAELHIYRGEKQCFNPLPLARWAGLSVSEGDDSDRAAHFIRYRPPPSARKNARSCRRQAGFAGHSASSAGEMPEEPSAALAGEAAA